MKKRIKKETIEEYKERGGKTTKLPQELAWRMFPQVEIVKLQIPILDYERDHNPRGGPSL
jgi:hypothetical protein